ncbi:hypothetical protein RFI_14382 [Reticulomyxa filosa]|uniref:Uncharacterized protein n=1 Tax=Reticulomyxa filosa TaxID=46433 RepID=X6NAM1_RETFI|nr:hypothetical protein RFI_14382 [Reticulomyxa filosa]|eukprot:ETO22814.1 hypothetical protein RFI_14382 [Reticulomyxa filosa]
MQVGWSIWIPVAVLSLAVLSLRMTETYSNINKMRMFSHQSSISERSTFEKLLIYGHSMVLIIAVFDWTGTILDKHGPIIFLFDHVTAYYFLLGSVYSFYATQTLLYALWKLIAVALLSSLIALLMKLFLKLKQQYDTLMRRNSLTNKMQMSRNLYKSMYKLLCLVFVLSVLVVCLFYQSIHEWITFVSDTKYQYVEETITTIAGIYLPLWSCVSAVNLVYSWIPPKRMGTNQAAVMAAAANADQVVSTTTPSDTTKPSVDGVTIQQETATDDIQTQST